MPSVQGRRAVVRLLPAEVAHRVKALLDFRFLEYDVLADHGVVLPEFKLFC